MAGKPTYNELEREIKQLEEEVLEYVRQGKRTQQGTESDRIQSYQARHKPDAYK